ncbi:hypothetical protein CR513_25642, partial [Mucuna pruriens]
MTTTTTSFCDKVLEIQQASSIREKSDFVAQKLVRIQYKIGNCLLPKVYLDEKVLQNLLRILKIYGAFHIEIDIMYLDNGFYMVKFNLSKDKDKNLEFISPVANVNKTLVWILFPSLNSMFYYESFLLVMPSIVSQPIKVDKNTLIVKKSKFACICVEIILTKFLVEKGMVRVEDHSMTITTQTQVINIVTNPHIIKKILKSMETNIHRDWMVVSCKKGQLKFIKDLDKKKVIMFMFNLSNLKRNLFTLSHIHEIKI